MLQIETIERYDLSKSEGMRIRIPHELQKEVEEFYYRVIR